MSCFTPSFRNKGPVSLAQLSAAPALHALVLCIPVLHCALREIGSGSACHQRGAQGAGYSVLRPALSQCIYREGAGAIESCAKHILAFILTEMNFRCVFF